MCVCVLFSTDNIFIQRGNSNKENQGIFLNVFPPFFGWKFDLWHSSWSCIGPWVLGHLLLEHLLYRISSSLPAVQRNGPGGDPVLPVPAQLLHSGQSECVCMLLTTMSLQVLNFFSLLLCVLRITLWRAWATPYWPSFNTYESLDWFSRGR